MFYNSQTQSALHAICRQLLEFVTPVYLAYYDESQRLNSDAELTKILLNASAILNSTTETAKYLVRYYVRCLAFFICVIKSKSSQLNFL